MTRIPLLPHWVITDKYPAFYDVESATAIEETSKVYGKMQELIEDYNKYADEINKTITEFINGTNSDQEEFKNQINKIMHDYIAMLDEKIKMQDSVIEDSIIYIKNNLSESVETLFNELIASGEVKNAITTYEYDLANETLIFKMGGAN